MIPEGRLGSGWRGFGLNLRKILKPTSPPKAEAAVVVDDRPHNHDGAKIKGKATTGIPKREASTSYASVVVGKQKNTRGGGDEGKNKTALVQNSNPRDFSFNNRDTCKESILRQREQLRAKILSTINGIESNGIKSELTLDLYMRMERGKDGRWAIVWSEVNGGPKSGATYKTHCS